MPKLTGAQSAAANGVRGQIIRAWPNLRKMLHHRGYEVGMTSEGGGTEGAPAAAGAKGVPATIDWHFVTKVLPGRMNWRLVVQRRARAPRSPPHPPPGAAAATAPSDAGSQAPPNADRLVVIFTLEAKVSIKTVRSAAAWMQREGIARAIVLSSGGATPCTDKRLGSFLPLRIEIMRYAFFGFCLIEHALVPPHQVLTPAQKRRLLDHFSIHERDLPKQLPDDPVSRYYGLEDGDVICYWRRNGNQEVAPYFRIVSTPSATGEGGGT
jgi:DNA-directed RNA polymerase subunit H (RpoH/RPB5)